MFKTTHKIIFLIIFLFLTQNVSLFCWEYKINEISIKIIRIDTVDNKYQIFYELSAPINNKYIISLYLKKRSDDTYKYKLNHVEGDVGEGYYVGTNKKIIWDINTEFQINQLSEDYYFLLGVKPITNSISPWIWIGSGIAVLGGATIYYFLTKKKDVPIILEGPNPPGRP